MKSFDVKAIKRAADDRNLTTQKRLAEASGLSLSTVQRVLAGKARPEAATIDALASTLGLTKGQLFGEPVAPALPPQTPMDLIKDVWIPVKGKVWATPFRISAGEPLGYVKGRSGEDSCFALVVEGESMLPVYKQGAVIVCRPDLVTLQACSEDQSGFVPFERMQGYNGKDAIVTHESETVLKRLVVERTSGPKWDLFMISLNPKFPKVKLHLGDDWILQAIVKRTEDEPEYLR